MAGIIINMSKVKQVDIPVMLTPRSGDIDPS